MSHQAPLVLHIITGLDPGGAEAMLQKLVGGGSRYRHAVVSLKKKGAIAPIIEAAGVPVYELNVTSPGTLVSGLLKLRDLSATICPKLLQGWLIHGNLATTLHSAMAPFKAPVVWNVRQSLVDLRHEKLLTRGLLSLSGKLSKFPEAIIYNSEAGASQHELIGYSPHKRRIIFNGFDLSKFQPDFSMRTVMRKSMGIEDSEVAIGLVARFHSMKNHAGFFAMAKSLASKHSNIRFILVGYGTGKDNAAILNLAGDETIRARTLFLGDRRDMPEVLSCMDIATNISVHGEGFPNAIGEAMAMEVPCVVTNIGDTARLVGDTGIVCQPNDLDGFAAAVNKLILCGKQYRQGLGYRARLRIIEHFELTAIVKQYDELYDEILQNANG